MICPNQYCLLRPRGSNKSSGTYDSRLNQQYCTTTCKKIAYRFPEKASRDRPTRTIDPSGDAFRATRRTFRQKITYQVKKQGRSIAQPVELLAGVLARRIALPGPSPRYGSIRKSNRFMASSSMTPSLTIASVVKSLNVPVDFAQSIFSPL